MARRFKVGVFAVLVAVVAVALSSSEGLAYTYSSAVLADSPLEYIPADDGSGGTAHAAAGGNAACFGMPWSGTGFVSGSSASLVGGGGGGNGCYVSTGLPAFSATWSLEAWVHVGGFGGNNTMFAVAGHGNGGSCGGNDWGSRLYFDGGGLQFGTYPACWGGSASAVTCVATAAGDYYVVGTYDGATARIYKNGSLCASAGASWSVPSSAVCLEAVGDTPDCGTGHSNDLASSARVGQVALYAGVLSGSQVLAHWNAATPGPAAALTVRPGSSAGLVGFVQPFLFTAVDAVGNDVTTGDVLTFVKSCTLLGAPIGGSIVPGCPAGGGAFSSCAMNGTGELDCTLAVIGSYVIYWSDSNGNTATTFYAVQAPAATFTINPQSTSVGVGGQVRYYSSARAADGTDVSASDSWTWQTLPGSVSCGVPSVSGGTYVSVCTFGALGSFTWTGHDRNGFPAQVTATVSGAAASVSCTGSIIDQTTCYAAATWQAITSLPGDLMQRLFVLLFVSPSGKSYLDVAAVFSFPVIACRTGELPNHPDGVHCTPFPFAVPVQLQQVWGVINVAAVSPTFTLSLPCGFLVQCTRTVDPTGSVLTPTVMGWVRGVEYVLFVGALGLAVRKYVQLFGVD